MDNVAQQAFMLFYAIAWGTAANSQPGWKAFAYPAICGQQGWKALLRILLSWVLLNLAAVCLFVWVLALLNGPAWRVDLKFWRTVAAIVPAIAPFGIYKLWMGIVQAGHAVFFTDDEVTLLQERHKNGAFKGSAVNVAAGVILIALAVLVANCIS